MATELSITNDRTEKFLNDLNTEKSLVSSCADLFTSLTSHFTSLHHSLSQKSQSLDSSFQSLQSLSLKSLDSLSARHLSIPLRESTAAAHLASLKATALTEFEKPQLFDNLVDSLRSLSRRMDSSGLLKFVISKRKESLSLRAEIPSAIREAVDPPRLVLDAVEELVRDKAEKVGVTDKRWGCSMLVQALLPEAGSSSDHRKGPEYAQSVAERAGKVLQRWKDEEGVVGPAEAVMFVQMVLGFRLKEKFDEEFMRKLVVENASRRDMAKLAAAFGFGEKMTGIIEELVKNGKEIEAVYFASECGLTERFPPLTLIKTCLKNSKKNTTTILKNGKYSVAATEESSTVELNSIKAIIKCVEDHKLESDFSLDSLRKRATQLERTKADRKKGGAAAATAKPPNKRSHGASGSRGGGPPAFRPSKAAKFSPSFSRRNPTQPARHSPAGRYSGQYNYPSQSVYDGQAAAPYAPTYGASHSQSPAGIPQQHYSVPVDTVGTAGFRSSGPYGGQTLTNYSGYDYGSNAPPTYPPSPYT